MKEIQGAELSAICDINSERLRWAQDHLPENVQKFDNEEAFFESKSMEVQNVSGTH